MGWYRCSTDGHEAVAELLTASGIEWPWSAIIDDLAYWEDRERFAKIKRPGRPALCARWNCGDWTARKALKSEAWLERSSSDSPARLQPASSRPPTPASAKADNGPLFSSRPPARLQPPSSDSPHARLQQTTDSDAYTDHDIEASPLLSQLPSDDSDDQTTAEALGPTMAEGHTYHCAARIVWGDGECECAPQMLSLLDGIAAEYDDASRAFRSVHDDHDPEPDGGDGDHSERGEDDDRRPMDHPDDGPRGGRPEDEPRRLRPPSSREISTRSGCG